MRDILYRNDLVRAAARRWPRLRHKSCSNRFVARKGVIRATHGPRKEFGLVHISINTTVNHIFNKLDGHGTKFGQLGPAYCLGDHAR